jgi:large subunit ribosomal protein L13
MELAVKGMLPHNTIGRKSATRLKVYAGAAHKHEAQKPEAYEI